MVNARRSLQRHFHQILSLASIAYTFTTLQTIEHSLEPSMADHEGNNTSALGNSTNSTTAQAHSQASTATSSTNNPSSISGGRNWTPDEIWLLLRFVEANCVFTAAKGINLKKSEFNKASEVVTTRTGAQCHTKWGRVSGFVIDKHFYYLFYIIAL
jgi:hypothetical protein